MTKRAARWIALLPFIVAVILFAPALGFEFLNYDDPMLLTSNTLVQYANGPNLLRLWSGPLYGDYHPLTHVAYFLEWQLGGGRAAVHHAVGILLHGISVLLVVKLLRPGLGLRRACAAALLFAVHPLVVEPVVWIASRKDVLALPLLLGGVLVFRHALADAERVRWKWAALGLLLGTLAVLSKSVAVVFPALVLWDWFTAQRRPRKPTRGEVALFLLAGLPALLAVLAKVAALEQMGAAGTIGPVGALERAELVATTYGTFLEHAALPLDLHLAYDPTGMSEMERRLCWASLLALPLAAWLLRERRAALFGLGWWVLALLPASQLFPFHIWAADRYAYPALPGLAALVVALLLPRDPQRSPATKIAFAVILALCTWLSTQQMRLWSDSRTLWSVHVDRDPDNRIAVPNLARMLLAEKRGEEARVLLAEHLEREPDNHRAGRLLAQLRARAGDFRGADALFARHTPCVEHVEYLISMNRRVQALKILEIGLTDRPSAPALLLLKAQLDAEAGDYARARAALERVARVDPAPFGTWVQLARACARGGDTSAGWRALRRSGEVGAPEYVQLVEAARLYVLEDRIEDARVELERALEVAPVPAEVLAKDLESDPELGRLILGP